MKVLKINKLQRRPLANDPLKPNLIFSTEGQSSFREGSGRIGLNEKRSEEKNSQQETGLSLSPAFFLLLIVFKA